MISSARYAEIAIGFFLSAGFGLAMAATERCPDPNTYTHQRDPHHWFSPPTPNTDDDAPSPCNTCDDPANSSSNACWVYYFLNSGRCEGSRCGDGTGTFNLYRSFARRYALQQSKRYQYPDKYPFDANNNCHFLLWALNPVIGLEDSNKRDNYNYWNQAYQAARKQVKPRLRDLEIGLAIQPATHRGQHQLHIHIGTLTPSYRHAIDGLFPDPNITQFITINGHFFHARYVLDARGKGPFTGLSPFEVASKMIPEGESSMPDYGIITARASNRRGIFVLAAKSVQRGELNYHHEKSCRLPAPPRLPTVFHDNTDESK